MLAATPEAARAIPRGTLGLRACAACGFVFNASFAAESMEYGAAYDNTQTCSPHFLEYVNQLATYLVDDKELRGQRIVEVGCGKGVFLRRLAELDTTNHHFYGFDPAYVGPVTELDGRVHFIHSYYTKDCAVVGADAVVCRHVIEHVPDPIALLRTVRLSLTNPQSARVFFETPCVEWILRNQVFWDFFYEHCSYFTANSLRTAFESAGFSVEAVRHVFGGQYLWIEANARTGPEVSRDPGSIGELATRYGQAEAALIASWQSQVASLAGGGKVALWGAGAKGTTFAAIVDPDAVLIACVVDVNPKKQGGFIPGTGHPIVPPQAIRSQGIKAVLVMNPNYRTEIEAQLRAENISVAVVDVSQLETRRQ